MNTRNTHTTAEEARRGDESGCVAGKLVGFGVLLGMADDALLEVEVSGSKRHGDDPKTVSTHARARARAISLCPSLARSPSICNTDGKSDHWLG